jgi:hypothetical protein
MPIDPAARPSQETENANLSGTQGENSSAGGLFYSEEVDEVNSGRHDVR